ncbi:MAG: ADOP family duplicated permease [Terriglobia bacterium]
MTWLRVFLCRLSGLFRRRRLEHELNEELRLHLDMLIEENLQRGMPPEDARYAALKSFGGVEQAKEQYRDLRGFTFIDSLLQDLRYAVRVLRKSPTFTLVAILTLAGGIGINTVFFTAFETVALRPVEAQDAGRMANVYRSTREDRYGDGFSYPEYLYYRDHNQVFSGLTAEAGTELTLSGAPSAPNPGSLLGGGISAIAGFQFPQQMAGSAEFISGALVSGNYFRVLGINAVRGRTFVGGEGLTAGDSPVVLISENFWQRRFNSDPKMLGSVLKLNGMPLTVLGITPKDFVGTWQNVPDVWLPMTIEQQIEPGSNWLENRDEDCCSLHGRLKPGVTAEKAQADMTVLTGQLRKTYLSGSKKGQPVTITITTGSIFDIGRSPQAMRIILLVLVAVGLVLLIACANVASLQLARCAARQKEIGVRLALGASRPRLVRQLLTESILISLVAGTVGLFFAWGALRVLVSKISDSLPVYWGILAFRVSPDLHVFTYTVLVSLAAGCAFGLVPALEASKPNLISALKEEGASFAGRMGRSRLRFLLVVAQVSVSMFLLIAAGLLVRGSSRALKIDPGFETRRVLGLDVEFPPGLRYSSARQAALLHQIMDRFGTVPGVISVTAANPPLAGGLRTTAVSIGGHKLASGGHPLEVYYKYVTPNYFQTLGIPIMRGRVFTRQQESAGIAVVVISQATASRFWPGEDPIGKQLTLDAKDEFHGRNEPFPNSLSCEVIGVAKDVRGAWLSEFDSSYIYLPTPLDRWSGPLMVRTQGNPQALMDSLATQVQKVDSNLVVYAESLEGLITQNPSFVFSRVGAILSTIIGLLGLLLASVGIFGMVSYAVVQRVHEIGVRMALGARKNDVLRLMVGDSMRPVTWGIGLGVAVALAASRVLTSLLFGLSPFDPVSYLAVSAFLLAVAALAAYIPALRATKVDPVVALRNE